jgi:hypothetical protein
MQTSATMMSKPSEIVSLPFTQQMLNALLQSGQGDIVFESLLFLKDQPQILLDTCRRFDALTSVCTSPSYTFIGPTGVPMTLLEYAEAKLQPPEKIVMGRMAPKQVSPELFECLVDLWSSYVTKFHDKFIGTLPGRIKIPKDIPFPKLELIKKRYGINPGECSKDDFVGYGGYIPLNTNRPAPIEIVPVYVTTPKDIGHPTNVFDRSKRIQGYREELLEQLILDTRQAYDQFIQTEGLRNAYPQYLSACFDMWLLDLFQFDWYLKSSVNQKGVPRYILAYAFEQ